MERIFSIRADLCSKFDTRVYLVRNLQAVGYRVQDVSLLSYVCNFFVLLTQLSSNDIKLVKVMLRIM